LNCGDLHFSDCSKLEVLAMFYSVTETPSGGMSNGLLHSQNLFSAYFLEGVAIEGAVTGTICTDAAT